MHPYVLSCCSPADLSREHFESRDIHFICFHYYLNDTAYPDDLGQTIPFDRFYQAMADGAKRGSDEARDAAEALRKINEVELRLWSTMSA